MCCHLGRKSAKYEQELTHRRSNWLPWQCLKIFGGGHISEIPLIGAAGGVAAAIYFRRRPSDSSALRRQRVEEGTNYTAAARSQWNHDFLANCLTRLRCYSLGFRECWRSCPKLPSSFPCLALGTRPGYRSAASAPPPLITGLYPLNWSSSKPLRTGRRSAPRPSPPHSARTARKLKVLWSWMNSSRKMISAAKSTATSRFQVLSCVMKWLCGDGVSGAYTFGSSGCSSTAAGATVNINN